MRYIEMDGKEIWDGMRYRWTDFSCSAVEAAACRVVGEFAAVVDGEFEAIAC